MALEIRHDTNMEKSPTSCAGCDRCGEGECSITPQWIHLKCSITGAESHREKVCVAATHVNFPLVENSE